MTGIFGAAIWLVVAIVFFVIESLTLQLVCIWFVAGALGAMLVSFLNLSLQAQLWVFLIASIASLFVFRPLVQSKINLRRQPTNADRVIGMLGVVAEPVDNLAGTGRVLANGLSWSAVARDDQLRIAKDQKIRVLAINGVKLVVEPVMEPETTPLSDQ